MEEIQLSVSACVSFKLDVLTRGLIKNAAKFYLARNCFFFGDVAIRIFLQIQIQLFPYNHSRDHSIYNLARFALLNGTRIFQVSRINHSA